MTDELARFARYYRNDPTVRGEQTTLNRQCPQSRSTGKACDACNTRHRIQPLHRKETRP